jgi:mannitol-1-phosphate 5-dehydrogenase
VLAETKELLIAKHGFSPEIQQLYIDTNLSRFANEELTDTVERVGRQPLRKLSRHERFIGPAAELAELGLPTHALERAISAAFRFDVPGDDESVELARLLSTLATAELVTTVTGIDPSHPLFARLLAAVS